MFTIDSNCLVGLCALLSIPYQIDGIRNGDFRLPRWIICALYIGTTATTVTMVTTVAILGPGSGWMPELFTDSNLIFHVFVPIFAILLFVLVDCEHRLSFKFSFITLIPVLVYALVYIIMVFVVGSDNGGWIDHYQFGVYIPWPATLAIMVAFSFGLSNGIRALHNLVHKKQKQHMKQGYERIMEERGFSAEDAVIALAQDNARHGSSSHSVLVPCRLLELFAEKGKSEKGVEELSALYLQEYWKDRAKK